MLISYLRHHEVTEVHEIEVEAPPQVTYAAIRKADLRDPVINALFLPPPMRPLASASGNTGESFGLGWQL